MSEINAELKAAQQRIQVLERNLRDAEEANRRLAKQVIKADQRVSDLNGEVLRLGLQLKHHLQLQAERDALVAKLAELEKQEPIGEVTHSDVLPNAEEKYRHEFVSDFRIGVQAELYARPIPAEQHVNARLLEALKWAADNPGDDAYWIEQARAAIASAESQAGPVRLTDDEIESYWTDNVEGWHLQFARAIESAVLRKNGIEVAE